MINYITMTVTLLCLFNVIAHADALKTSRDRSSEPAGLGLGALVGGLIAGPPGAIIGAAGGGWLASRGAGKNTRIADLERELVVRDGQFAALQAEFAALENGYGRELQPVNADRRSFALDQISRGVSLTVYFRTASAQIDPEFIPRIERLAALLDNLPGIRLHLDAHADRRGRPAYNHVLSEQRAETVRGVLTSTGLAADRIQSHAYGETQALAAEGDDEGYVFDRRVVIQLTADSGV